MAKIRRQPFGDGRGEMLKARVGRIGGVAAGTQHEVAGVGAGRDPLDGAA